MNYLFFDVECANNYLGKGKICEFGYILTDMEFNVIAQESIKINPKAKFDKKLFERIGMVFDEPYEYYESQPDFKVFYHKIQELLCNPHNVVIGHGTKNDAQYLIDECDRYKLPALDYIFYDTSVMATCFYQRTEKLKLVDLYREFCGEEQAVQKHSALEDAYMTMMVSRFYETNQKKELKKLLSFYSQTQFESFKGRIIEMGRPALMYSESNKLGEKNKRILNEFISQQMAYNSDHVYVMAKEWEHEHFRELLIVLTQMKKIGVQFNFSLKDGNTYVSFGTVNNKYLKYVEKCQNNGHEPRVRVIDFTEFLREIGLDEASINIPNEEFDEIVGNLKSNRKWFDAYKKTHTSIAKINDKVQGNVFECGVDLPVIQYQATVTVEKDGVTRDELFSTYYDYLLNDFFHPHPYRVNRGANSYLPKSCYKQAIARSEKQAIFKIAQYFKCSAGERIRSIKIINRYPYITSYKFTAWFNGNNLEFEFPQEILADDDYKGSILVNLSRYKLDIEGALRELYDEKIFALSLQTMAKFKFGYKDKSFTAPKLENKSYREGDEILLPKEYYIKSESGQLTDEYLPSLIDIHTELFKKSVRVPVLIKRVQKK